jgi:hypothetical protein
MYRRTTKAAVLLAVFFTITTAGVVLPMIRPAPTAEASILTAPCDIIPLGILKKVCSVGSGVVGSIPDPIKAVGGIIGGAVGSVANAIFRPLLQLIANAEAGAIVGTLKGMANGVIKATAPQLTAKWFLDQYAIVLGMGVFLALGLFLGSLGEAVANQDLATGFSSGLILLAFLLLGGTIPFLVGALTRVCDLTIAPGMMNASGDTFQHVLRGLGTVDFTKGFSVTNNIGTALLTPIVVMFVGVIMGVVVAFMDVFREAALYLTTAAMAITTAMTVSGRWGPDAFNRNLRVLLALVFFNVYYALIMSFGVSMFASNSTKSPVILGTAIIMLAPILAFWTYRAISRHYPDTGKMVGLVNSLSSGVKKIAPTFA